MKIKELSIILPIYNEEARLNKSFNRITKLFGQFKSIKIEIIFVNDGSTDKSHELINNFIRSQKKDVKKKIIYVNYKKNKGKGYALKQGIKNSSKKWKLTCDIDFSTNPIEVRKWAKLNLLKEGKNCYFGSRSLKNSKVKFSYHRYFLGNLFNIIVSLMFDIKIGDTQCGFKLYHKNYAKKIFSNLKEFGYSHDVEIAILLKKNSISVFELPIKWEHREKSRLNIFYDGILMIFKLLLIKLRY
tara:strand:+ start:882 stop:1610 length:729 start_codon:yes stop_codon:yes gene_type:complete